MWVPYDEKRIGRTLRFILKPQMRLIRVCGGVFILLGLVLVAQKPPSLSGYVAILAGLLFMVAMGPIVIARAIRMQSDIIKEGLHMSLDDESLTVTYPLVESRLKWAGLGRVVETPEVWYIMFGKMQAVTIPKNSMTEQQRAEFGAFVKTLQPFA